MSESIYAPIVRYGVVYKVTNSLNGKVYIGQTVRTIKKRWKSHFTTRNCRDDHFARALRKYPKDCWEIETLCVASYKKELDDL